MGPARTASSTPATPAPFTDPDGFGCEAATRVSPDPQVVPKTTPPRRPGGKQIDTALVPTDVGVRLALARTPDSRIPTTLQPLEPVTGFRRYETGA